VQCVSEAHQGLEPLDSGCGVPGEKGPVYEYAQWRCCRSNCLLLCYCVLGVRAVNANGRGGERLDPWQGRQGGSGRRDGARNGSRRTRRVRMEQVQLRSDEKVSAAPASTSLCKEHKANTSGDKRRPPNLSLGDLASLLVDVPASRMPLAPIGLPSLAPCLALASPGPKAQSASLFLVQQAQNNPA
jgi:hypothetical protein